MKEQEMSEKDVMTPEFLAGGGEMGQRIREFNWANTPLGPVHTWPRSLRTCVRIMLTSRQPIWIGWGKELIKLYNDPYKAIVGGKHPDALGQPASVVWNDIWRDIEPLLKTVMEKDEGTYVESQLLIMERNGYPEETYYTFSYTPIPGDNKGTAGMICANTDDTERIIGERQLKTLTQLGKKVSGANSEQNVYERTIEVLQQNPYDFPFALIYVLQENNAVLGQHTGLGTYSGNVPGTIRLDETAELSRLMKRAANERKIQMVENISGKLGAMPAGPWQKPPGNAIVVPIGHSSAQLPHALLVVGLNPYRLPDSKYLNFFQLVTDLVSTSLANVQRIDEERKRLEAMAEVDRAKTIFFSNISHEFRTPLTLMLAPIEELLNDRDTIERNRVRMQVAYDNALRLLKLVNTLLDFSRIEAGKMHLNFQYVDLGMITRDLASAFRSAVEKAGITYIVDCENLDEPVPVDPDMWEKIVLNLISNAFKYTERGTIKITLHKNNYQVHLTVADTGIGIPPDQREKIFERFHRVHNAHGRSQEGTGIGLSVVKELVKLHHGQIEVTSTPGQGSVFRVSIPLASRETGTKIPAPRIHTLNPMKYEVYVQEVTKWLPDQNEQKISIAQSGTADATDHPPLVLLADDNADMRDYVKRLLSEQYTVDVVANGTDALQRARANRYDLIISDVMMPGMNGFELVHQLKSGRSTTHIPVILLSARAGEEATIEGLAAGADDYLVKPFSARELLSRVHSTIRIARTRQAAEKNMYKVFMQTPVAIVVLKGRELIIELANQKTLDILGRSEEQVINKPLPQALPELAKQAIKRILIEVLESGTPFYGNEIPLQLQRHGKMEARVLNLAFEPLYDEGERITGILGSGVDVTELVSARKLVEANKEKLEVLVAERTQELKNANINLERSNVELEQFAHVASHDLKEPLRKIKTFAGRLEDEFKGMLPDKGKLFLEKIQASANRMYSMMEGVLVYSSVKAGEQKIEPVNLMELVKNIEHDLELIIQQKSAVIRAQNLPVIDGAPVLIYQLFYNLINNSLKFSKNGVPPEIVLTGKIVVANGNEYAEITVADNGIGFHPTHAEQIFNTFTRLHSKEKYEGTGLGLALSKKIVERHHGTIEAHGETEEGATFIVRLPLKQKDEFK